MQNLTYQQDPSAEFIAGNIVLMSPRPAVNHNRVIANLMRIFGNYLRGKHCEAFAGGVDLHLDEENVLLPDVMIVSNLEMIHPNGVFGVPDLVVEVLSPSTARRDRGIKMETYARFGIKEYWLILPLERMVEVYLLQGGKFVLDNVYTDPPFWDLERMSDGEKEETHLPLKVSFYDDFLVNVGEIFERVTLG